MEIIKAEMRPVGISMEVDREQFALALKTWRLRVGKTQKEVADQWGISRDSLIQIEQARNVSWRMAYRVFARFSEELRKEGGK